MPINTLYPITTDGNGYAAVENFETMFYGSYVRATVIDDIASNGNTSEYSNRVYIPGPSSPPTGTSSAAGVTTSKGTSYTFSVTYAGPAPIQLSTIGDGDIRVSGPNGFNSFATLVSVSSTTNGTPITATYRITPPDGTWDATDNGTYTLWVVPGAVADTALYFVPSTSVGTFTVAAPSVVQSVTINDGSAQRSMVKSLTVTFDGLVTFNGSPTAAFEVLRTGPTGTVGNVTVSVDLSGSTATQTVARLTFSGSFTEYGSLIDGNYTLIVNGTQVTGANGQALDGDGDGIAGGNCPVAMFRLFGDGTGDRTVSAADLNMFQQVYGSASGDITFDFNSDGVINQSDLDAFRSRYGAYIPPES